MPASTSKTKAEFQSMRVRPDFPARAKRKAAIKLFEQGRGYKFVAKALGLSVNTVHDWQRAYRHGQFEPEVSRKLYRYPDEVRQTIVRMRRSGWSWGEISKETGVSIASCRKWVAQEAQTAKQIKAREEKE